MLDILSTFESRHLTPYRSLHRIPVVCSLYNADKRQNGDVPEIAEVLRRGKIAQFVRGHPGTAINVLDAIY